MKQIQIKEYPKNTISKDKSTHSIYEFVLSFSKAKLRTLNLLIKLKSQHRNLYASQSYFASQIGVTRQTINEIIKFLEEHKLIDSTYYHFQTKSYRIGAILHNPYIRKALLGLLPALVSFPIYGSLLSKSDTNIIKEVFIVSNIYSYTKKSEYMSNEQRYASVVTNLNKLYKNEDVQPDYADVPQKKPIICAKSIQNFQKRESSKPNCKNIAINRAKRLFEEAQKGRRNRFYIKQNIKVVLQDFPSSIDEFEQWFYSSDGKDFKLWFGYEFQDFFLAQTV